jgi:hypothetical protein
MPKVDLVEYENEGHCWQIEVSLQPRFHDAQHLAGVQEPPASRFVVVMQTTRLSSLIIAATLFSPVTAMEHPRLQYEGFE